MFVPHGFHNVGARNSWIAFQLVGTKSNRDGIGARVKVVSGDLSQVDEVLSGGSYLSQNDLRLHFGFGQRTKVDLVVLATGMAASVDGHGASVPLEFDKDNFALPRRTAPGVFSAGCARGPADVATSVQDATAAALEAIQAIHGAAAGRASKGISQ